MERVGIKLKALRNETGLSGRKFADAAGVDWGQYNSWEHMTKKPTLPIETVRVLVPAFEKFRIDPLRVWENLGGISRADLLGGKGKDQVSIRVDDGHTAVGVPAQIYTSTSDKALVRYVGPGLVVIAETESAGVKISGVYKIGSDDNDTLLIPFGGDLDENRGPDLIYQPTENWHTGTVQAAGTAHTKPYEGTCSITLVVRELSTLHNHDYLK
ncbi:MAG: helix-turn-helix transcriptional regulator [Kordiimonadaceae bacterium]|nr:helix-turn-helix transcriptional regulator [Kordiimonadaceae bacterium]